MTSAYNGPSEAALRALLSDARCLLLDFDGPVCHLFSGHPAVQVADSMRRHLRDEGYVSPSVAPRPGLASRDPLQVLLALAGHKLAPELELLLTEEEESAARTAQPTPLVAEFIQAVADSDRILAITTNNAPGAAEAYLKEHGLDGFFERRIYGRVAEDPTLMKPDPDCLLRAIDGSGLRPGDCLMVGDSPSDAAAAKAAGVPFLGYARSADRVPRLQTVDRYPVVVGMQDLVAAAQDLLPPNG